MSGSILTAKDIERFWRKVRFAKGCWIWQASFDSSGYGHIRIRGRLLKAHRVAYQIATGENPGTQCVCHTCDNPACCKPAHLWLGTKLDNARDRDIKGRANKRMGVTHGGHKLTELQVREIKRQLRDCKWGDVTRLATIYNVWPGTISAIKHGRLWKHV